MKESDRKENGLFKRVSIDLNEFCKNNKDSQMGDQEVEITDENLLRRIIGSETDKQKLWQFIAKGKK